MQIWCIEILNVCIIAYDHSNFTMKGKRTGMGSSCQMKDKRLDMDVDVGEELSGTSTE